MAIFQLMNKDRRIGLVECNASSIRLFNYDKSLVDLQLSTQDFLDSRLNPVVGRKNIELLLKEAEINNRVEFFKISKALSLNDTLWIRELNDKITWEQVSPYRNRISRIISEIALEGNYRKRGSGDFKSPSPEYETGGSYSKCWKRVNGSICLIKGGEEKYNGISGNSSYNEYFACQVAETLGIKYYAKYRIFEREDEKGKRAFTRCKLFTNEEFGYLPIGDSKYKKSSLKETYNLMKSLGNEHEFREMLLLDSLIYNIDRHRWNYGFMIDNRNYKIVKMAPIFDNNLSFLSKVSINDRDELKRQLRVQVPRTMEDGGNFIKQGWMAINGYDDLRKRLKNMTDFTFNRVGIKYLESERMDFMEALVRNQARKILSA